MQIHVHVHVPEQQLMLWVTFNGYRLNVITKCNLNTDIKLYLPYVVLYNVNWIVYKEQVITIFHSGGCSSSAHGTEFHRFLPLLCHPRQWSQPSQSRLVEQFS